MTNIVGTGLNQAPTNADLGTLAFQDAAGVGELNVNTLTANALRVNNDVSTAVPVVNFNFGAGQNFYGTNCSFTRNCTATYFDKFGAMQIADVDEPRIDYDPLTGECKGLLIEGTASNSFLYSETPATQDITISVSTPYTLSFYGTGTITLSGAATATINGLGVYPVRTTYTFTPDVGTLTITVSGSVQKVQVEANAWASSYIPTYSSANSRVPDIATITPNTLTVSGFSVVVEASKYTNNDTNVARRDLISVLYNGVASYSCITRDISGKMSFITYDNSTQVGTYLESSAVPTNTFRKYALATSLSSSTSTETFIIDGANVKTKQSLTTVTTSMVPSPIRIGAWGSSYLWNGHIKRISYYNTRLSNKELTELVS